MGTGTRDSLLSWGPHGARLSHVLMASEAWSPHLGPKFLSSLVLIQVSNEAASPWPYYYVCSTTHSEPHTQTHMPHVSHMHTHTCSHTSPATRTIQAHKSIY